MTEAEFRGIVENVMEDYIPKVKATDRREFVSELISELQHHGIDLDESDEEEVEEGPGFDDEED